MEAITWAARVVPPIPAPLRGASPDPGVDHALRHAAEVVDFGQLIVGEDGWLYHANRCARMAPLAGGALCIVAGRLVASEPASQARLKLALTDATRGLRRVFGVQHGSCSSIVATLPLQADRPPGDALVLVVLERQPECADTTLALYGSALGLTAAEVRVLGLLNGGLGPKQIASRLGVALSTVRTQLQSIRSKTGSKGLRDLLSRVAQLPPVADLLTPWAQYGKPKPESDGDARVTGVFQ